MYLFNKITFKIYFYFMIFYRFFISCKNRGIKNKSISQSLSDPISYATSYFLGFI